DEAAGGGGVEDDGGFGHLDHEGGAAARQVVGRADAGEDAVDDGESGGFGRYERTGLGQDGDDRGLAQVGAFTAHVGAGDDGDEIGGIVEVEIVGNEAPGFLFGEALDDGMAAGEYTHLAGTRERGALVAVLGGDLGERGGDVEFGDGGGGGADALRVAGGAFADVGEEFLFEGEDLFLGIEHLALGILQLGGRKTFGVGQGLLAFVIGGGEILIGAGDFDVVAGGVVGAYLERGDAGALALAGLDLGDVLLAVLAEVAELVELG